MYKGNSKNTYIQFSTRPLTIMVWYGSLNKTYHVVFIKHMHFILDKAREWQGVINSHKSIATTVRKDTDRHIKTIKQSKQ